MREFRGLRQTITSALPLLVFLVYCLNFDNLLGYLRLGPLSYQLAGLASVAAFFVIFTHRSVSSQIHSLVHNPLMRWLAFLIFLSLPYSLISDPSVSSQGLNYLVTTALIITTLVLCAEKMHWSNTSSVMLALAVAIACFSVLADPLIDFRQFFAQVSDQGYERTRAAGVFLQPNAAGTSLVFLLAAAIPRVGRVVAVLLSCLVSAAVFLTFSRSGLVLLFVVLFLSAWRRFLPRYLLLTVVAVVFVWTTTSLKDVIAETFRIDEGSGYVRLIHLQDMLTSSALLNDSRASTAEQAYSDSIYNPLGGGLGYSWRWAEMQSDQQGTHNQILRYMLEYGIVGVFIWPLFLLALFRCRNKDIDFLWMLGICLCGFIASLFSHNLTESGSLLAPLMAALLWPPRQRAVALNRRANHEHSARVARA